VFVALKKDYKKCPQKGKRKKRQEGFRFHSDFTHCCPTPVVLLLLRLALFGAQ
jgi:hypothetical protein